MPDIDVFFGNAPWDPLAIHRGFTHGLVGGVLVMPPILAALLWLLDRRQLKHGTEFKSGLSMRFGWLLALSYLGAITHPFLDLLTTYSVQLYSPLSSAWYHADGLFIIDVWIWLLLATAIGISKRREQHGKEWRRSPQIAIGILFAYIGVNLLITDRADAEVRSYNPQAPGDFRIAAAGGLLAARPRVAGRPLLPPQLIRSDRGRFGRVGACEPSNMSDPLVHEAIRSDRRLQKFLEWSILPQADVIRGRCAARVTIGDARYGEGRRSRLARETVIPTHGAGC